MKREQRYRPRAPAYLLVVAMLTGCGPGDAGSLDEPSERASASESDDLELVLRGEVARIDAAAAAIDSIFQPLPLLTPGEEEGLRSASNARQLASARTLGIGRGFSNERLASLESDGALVRLEQSEYWVVRDLDHSQPLAVPAVPALLDEIGERFQRRLAELGAPPYRLEITSVLRTADDQRELRRVNPNAALGESTHEYGTTVDVLYSAYSAPSETYVDLDPAGLEWTEAFLRRYADVAAERVAARRALEIKAILGHVLLELQREGRVHVTLERQQPVFHMTVAADG